MRSDIDPVGPFGAIVNPLQSVVWLLRLFDLVRTSVKSGINLVSPFVVICCLTFLHITWHHEDLQVPGVVEIVPSTNRSTAAYPTLQDLEILEIVEKT